MNMLERVYNYLNDAGLLDGWTAQVQLWNDTGVGTDRFLVLKTSGGTGVRQGLSNDFYFKLFVVGQQGQYDAEVVDNKANEIIEYIKENPIDSCLNYIQMQSPLGDMMLTEERRPVHELLLRVVYG